MVSGNIGSTTIRRLDYTVIGDTVNTAQRIQTTAKGSQILISEECYEKVKQSFQCENIGSFQLKNKATEVMIFSVIN